jgi:hypothetical protein
MLLKSVELIHGDVCDGLASIPGATPLLRRFDTQPIKNLENVWFLLAKLSRGIDHRHTFFIL